jgi:hypothetical protein
MEVNGHARAPASLPPERASVTSDIGGSVNSEAVMNVATSDRGIKNTCPFRELNTGRYGCIKSPYGPHSPDS